MRYPIMNEISAAALVRGLFQDVRTKRGLAYSVGGAYGASYDHPGTFYVGASTKSASTVDATQAMLDAINELKTVPFTEEELKRAKDQVLNSFIFRYDSADKVLSEQAKLEFYGYPLDSLDKYRDAVEKSNDRRPGTGREKIHRPIQAGDSGSGQLLRIWNTSLEAGDRAEPRHHHPHAARHATRSRRRSAVSLAIAIMAAGKGTRLKSKRPKVLHEIGGKPLLAHVIAAASQIVLPKDIFVIVGHEAERVKAAVASTEVQFVLQAEQRGTGHAIQSAREQVQGYETLLVLSGDAPLIRPETIARMRDFHFDQQAAMTILTAVPENPFGYGRVIRKAADSPKSQPLSSRRRSLPEQQKAPEINSGIYAFVTGPLFANIDSLQANNSQGEIYLTDMAGLLVADGKKVVAIRAEDPTEVLGANTIPEMMELDAAMRAAAAKKLMAAGVTIFRPETVTIDAGVTVGADTVIEPFVQLLGQTNIGEDCRIRSYSVIENSTLADNVLIRQGCIIGDSTIDAGGHDRPLFPSPPRQRDWTRRARRQLRRNQEGQVRQRLQG